jgi:MFS family permease
VLRASMVTLVVTLLAMPLADSAVRWVIVRLLAGFASALVFVGAVNLMMERLRHHSPHLAGWGFSGIGIGIAASGLLVFTLPDWRSAWWAVGLLAAMLSAGAWATRHDHDDPRVAAPHPQPSRQNPSLRRFVLLLTCYTLEGIGYIIAGTFLVAAIQQGTPGWLGNGAWIVVGVAAAPSAVLWAWLSGHFSHPPLLAGALLLQAVGIALPAVAGGAAAALAGAILFGVTFVGVSTVALAAGAHLGVPRAVALLTAGYSVGQIAGPLAAAALIHHGYHAVLIVGSGVVVCAAAVAALLWIGYPDTVSVSGRVTGPDRGDRLSGATTRRRRDRRR